jgi:hypothetical protein
MVAQLDIIYFGFQIRFLSVVFISCSIQHIWVLFHHFLHISFIFLFESSVSFVFRIDSLATRKTIIAVLFLLVFWFLLLLGSYIQIWIVLLSWFYLVLV